MTDLGLSSRDLKLSKTFARLLISALFLQESALFLLFYLQI